MLLYIFFGKKPLLLKILIAIQFNFPFKSYAFFPLDTQRNFNF